MISRSQDINPERNWTYPSDILRKPTTKNRARDGTHTPHGAEDTKIISPESERNDISHDDLAQGDDTATTNTLQGSPDKHIGEVLRYSCDDRSHEEKQDSR
jgi:hypothetical protein